MNKTKDTLFWIVDYTISLTSLIASLPITLFLLYPYSIVVNVGDNSNVAKVGSFQLRILL